MTSDDAMSPNVRRSLDEMWPSVYRASRAHLADIEVWLLAGENASTAQHLAAVSAAHRLSGSLGMFGRHDASSVAASIEALLSKDFTSSWSDLRTLVDRLAALLSPTA